jgi:hypothetical protein
MKNLFRAYIIFLISTTLSSSCEDQSAAQNCDSSNPQQIETFLNDEFANNPCSIQNISTEEKEVNLVIKTQADYEKYFICSFGLPVVDFDKYFILAGRYQHFQCAIFDNQQVLLCNNIIIYKVSMERQVCQAITNVFYSVVIERQFENLDIEFDVKFLN